MVNFDPSPFERRTIPAISSAERFSTPVRTRMLDPNTSPAGSALTSSAMALAIWRIVMSSATNFAVGTSITTCGAAMPWIEVFVTPALNNRRANSSAIRPSCVTPMGPEITTSVTRSLQLPRKMTGSSASSGSVEIPSSAVSTSAFARDISQSGSNSNEMRARPSVDRLLALDTPSTANKAGSRTFTMP